MKHIKLFVAALMMLATTAFLPAQTITATYHSAHKEREVHIHFPNEKNNDYSAFIEIRGKYKSDDNHIVLGSKSKIIEFHDYLITLRDKYIEWKKVAKENGVKDYTKPFNINSPKVPIYWYSSEWFSSDNISIEPFFAVTETGECGMISGGKVEDWENEYIDTNWYFFLSDESEFNELIDALDIEKIKLKNKANASTDDLFQ